MKKFAAIIAGFSAFALSVSFAAPPPTATGTFSGTVGGLCVLKSSAFDGSLKLVPASSSVDSDGFYSKLQNDAAPQFTFRSNTACTANVITGTPQAPAGETGLVGACSVPDEKGLLGKAQTKQEGTKTEIVATITDGGDKVLLAGSYSLQCTVSVSAVN